MNMPTKLLCSSRFVNWSCSNIKTCYFKLNLQMLEEAENIGQMVLFASVRKPKRLWSYCRKKFPPKKSDDFWMAHLVIYKGTTGTKWTRRKYCSLHEEKPYAMAYYLIIDESLIMVQRNMFAPKKNIHQSHWHRNSTKGRCWEWTCSNSNQRR